MPEIDLQSALETNIVKLGTLEIEAMGDRVFVLQDEFRSGYECVRCGGRDIRNDVSMISCENCAGQGHYFKDGNLELRIRCSACDGRGAVKCPDCDGKGGSLITPDSSERRPTTGTILSIGKRVQDYKRGQGILYDSFSGHFWTLLATDIYGNEVKIEVGILREDEIKAKIKGHLELRRVRKSAALHTAA